ncbi:MAG: phosphoglucomutase/phosphomannomutase family protein [Christensenellales bacterium]|jgi:phosphomannomutase
MIRFGTGGWRAIIGEDFIRDNVILLTHAVAQDLIARGQQHRPFVIGYDRRFLSERAVRWMAEVLCADGIPVEVLDRVAPTPEIMFTVKAHGGYYGAAITASHNPAVYNGIKLFMEGGRDMDADTTGAIEARIDALAGQRVPTVDYEQGVADGRIKVINPQNDYLDAILALVDTDVIRAKGPRILLDPMFGVSRTCLQTILLTARCDVDIINDRRDTLFGGRLPSPTAATLYTLSRMVKEEGYDLGLGTDGDADRIGLVDEQGNFIHPNDILCLLTYYLLGFKGWKGDVVRNLATTHRLDRLAAHYGQTCHEVPVGFKHISSGMARFDAVIGGESSGGLTIRGHIPGKDGIFAAALLVEMICATGRTLSQILADIDQLVGRSYVCETEAVMTPQLKGHLQARLAGGEVPDFGREVDRVRSDDGIKVYFKDGGWVLARFSGTEPLLRLVAEMGAQAEADQVCAQWAQALGLEVAS